MTQTLDTDLAAGQPMPQRAYTRRHYLMCRPTYFDVRYRINPWMDPSVPTDPALAMRQWESLRQTFTELGHHVDVIEGAPGLPDMVFAANAGTVVHGAVVAARFRSEHRTGEEAPYIAWFRDHFSRVQQSADVNEGEGDLLWTGKLLLSGTGFRTAAADRARTAEALGVPGLDLELVDPSFYHLDTALAVLDADTIAYLPRAFSPASQRVLAENFPDAIVATLADARWFGLNAVSDGLHVILPEQAPALAAQLAERGFEPVTVDVSEFRKAGGGVKCCTLELRD